MGLRRPASAEGAFKHVKGLNQGCLSIPLISFQHRSRQDCVHDTFKKFGSSRLVWCRSNSHVNARPSQDTTAIPRGNETTRFMKVLRMCIAAVLCTSPSRSVCPRAFAFSCAFPNAYQQICPSSQEYSPSNSVPSIQKRRTNPGVSKQKSIPISSL